MATNQGAADPDRRVEAMPTKRLFIEMLTKDIGLIPAILDLVDNSVDGARRMVGDGPYDDFWVRVEIDESQCRVHDNCGGIPVDTARHYAFRFGRPDGAPSVRHSIGEFGVGMKRAIFKIGRAFEVDSKTSSSRFVISEDVREWAREEKQWNFQFDVVEEDASIPEGEVGTTVTITELKEEVAEEFSRESFRNQLREQLRDKLQVPLTEGLAVSLNGISIDADPLELLGGSQLAPAFQERMFDDQDPPVRAKIFAGLGPMGEPAAAGWHIFCNGRLILQADKSDVTGWGTKEGTSIPSFHPQYNQFRGYVYFDSDDTGRLPWNTTKTGLSTDSPIYRATRQDMQNMMRPVINFLNRLAEEKGEEGDGDGSLQRLIKSAPKNAVGEVQTREKFEQPEVKPIKRGPKYQRIQYDVLLDEAKTVKKFLGAKTWKQVGEDTFRYFYNAEIPDE